MMRASSKMSSPLQAGQTRMALSSSSIIRSPPFQVALEPGERPGQAVVERGARRPLQDGLGAAGVEHAASLLAGARRRASRCDTDARQLRQPAVELVDRGLAAGRDVGDAGRVVAGDGTNDRVGDVLDEDVVTRLLAVAIDETRLTGQEPVTEDGDDT